MPVTDDETLRSILDYETVAVVGCSGTPGKPAYDIPRYLDRQGYNVIPVNPFAEDLLGKTTYDSLSEVPEEIDIVDVFRPSEEVSEIVDEALERDDVSVIWLQLGINDDDAVARAEDDGRQVVEDRCMKPEHQRLMA